MNKTDSSAEAQSDLAEIQAYIAEELENPAAASATVRKIVKDIDRLREYSLLGTPLSAVYDTKQDYRFLVTGNYLTFYRVVNHNVHISRVLYGRRDYLRVLLKDLQQEADTE